MLPVIIISKTAPGVCKLTQPPSYLHAKQYTLFALNALMSHVHLASCWIINENSELWKLACRCFSWAGWRTFRAFDSHHLINYVSLFIRERPDWRSAEIRSVSSLSSTYLGCSWFILHVCHNNISLSIHTALHRYCVWIMMTPLTLGPSRKQNFKTS